jgi:hypothetical protein
LFVFQHLRADVAGGDGVDADAVFPQTPVPGCADVCGGDGTAGLVVVGLEGVETGGAFAATVVRVWLGGAATAAVVGRAAEPAFSGCMDAVEVDALLWVEAVAASCERALASVGCGGCW